MANVPTEIQYAVAQLEGRGLDGRSPLTI